MWHLVYHPCEFAAQRDSDWCRPWLAPPQVSSSIKSWMRNHDCASSFDEWHTSHLNEPIWTYTDWQNNSQTTLSMSWDQLASTATTIGCCDSCAIAGGNVDVYYWPVSGSNNDCTSIIGTSALNPDDGFFTTDIRGHRNFASQSNPYATINDSDDVTSMTTYNVERLRYRTDGLFSNTSTSTNESAAITQTMSGSVAIISGHTLFVSPKSFFIALLTQKLVLLQVSTSGLAISALETVVVQ